VTTKADAPGTGQSDVISKPLFARTSDLSFCSISLTWVRPSPQKHRSCHGQPRGECGTLREAWKNWTRTG